MRRVCPACSGMLPERWDWWVVRGGQTCPSCGARLAMKRNRRSTVLVVVLVSALSGVGFRSLTDHPLLQGLCYLVFLVATFACVLEFWHYWWE